MKQANRNTLLVKGSVFVVGVVFGIFVGAVSGLLFAPQTGEDICKHLRIQADGAELYHLARGAE